jgi:hypothetical protein
MSISAVTPRPASSRVAARWRIVAAALTLIGLHALTPLSDQAIAFPKADVAVSRPRP